MAPPTTSVLPVIGPGPSGKAWHRTLELPAPRRSLATIDPGAILASLRNAIIVLDQDGTLVSVNAAAEQLFDGSAATLSGARLDDFLPGDHPIFALIAQVRLLGSNIAEYAVTIDTPRLGRHSVSLQLAPLPEHPGHIVLTFQERSMAEKLDRQLVSRNAARSVTAMAAILAHEVKNPLSGIRGAAQLLEQNADDSDRELTTLICEEADRICALVNRMEMFSDGRPLAREPVNIHQVLERVRRSAQNGFGRHVRFIEEYDPSLPSVDGNRDMLVQVVMNLIKNAAEAVPEEGGEITLSTSYSAGVRVATSPGRPERRHLPLVVSIQDNGPGIPEELRSSLFDPFITTKCNGTGLGLALVAKIVGDHGGIIEFDSHPNRTVFRLLLPVSAG